MDVLGIFLQSALDSELLHFALAALAAVFACLCSVIGVGLGIVVKRAIAKWFERQDNLEKRIQALESAESSTAVADHRP